MIEKLIGVFLDLTNIRIHNVPKLITKEDFNHYHKFLGIMSMLHYLYRAYLFVTTGSMQFTDSNWTFIFIVLHAALSLSSLLFRIPETRIRSAPMIYPEFRLHSIVFASRSLVIMLIMYLSRRFNLTYLLYLRGLVVILTMVLADLITDSFKNQGTTMRAMPFPDYIPERMRSNINMYYSISQIFATGQMMYSYRMDESFLVLFPIQLAAFLMTCVRKSIITAGAWHFYYSLALGLNYLCCPFLRVSVNSTGLSGMFFPVTLFTMVFRFNFPSVNKYIVWTVATLVHIISMSMFGLYKNVLI